jgi:hypothetical protein
LNEHATRSRYRTVTIYRSKTRDRQTFTFKVLAKKGKAAHGVYGDVDALYIGY